MEFQITEEAISTVSEHANVSIAFDYQDILELTIANQGLGGFVLTEKHLTGSRTKDYDVISDDHPSDWPKRFDVSKWGFLVVRADGRRIGGAVIAFDTADMDMLEKRKDLAVLWDIRVDRTCRGHGIGVALFKAVENWSIQRGCTRLKIETQNNNLAACKFYARQGCTLGAINRFAYPNLPNEIQLLWWKDLVVKPNA